MYNPLERPGDPSQNFLENLDNPLDKVFNPKSIAVIGATEKEGSVGRTLMNNLVKSDFGGKLYGINPKRDKVLGVKCFPSVGEVPGEIDLAVIVTPAKTVLSLIKECVAKKIKAAIIISAGFKELGPQGQALEEEVVKTARAGGMRIVGPNCLGVMNPVLGLNATFAADMAFPGNIAFISQSGAMCTAVLDWSLKEKIGFSSFVSIGSMADIEWGDLIEYLGNDPHTKSILIYMESIGHPRSFLSAARRVALNKPIIVIKSGRSAQAAQAAASHTGSMAGSDDVLDAAFRRAGVIRVDTISELFDMALVLGKQPSPQGPNLTILTNAGGPAVLATDATAMSGAELTALDKGTIEKLNRFLPEAWSHSNPVDLLGDADADRYAKALEVVAHDKNSHGILVILSPQDMTEPEKTAQALKAYQNLGNKPLLASWMGGDKVAKGAEILKENGIPCFDYPDDAAKIFARMWQHRKRLESLYETPAIRDDISNPKTCSLKHQNAQTIIHKAQEEGRTLLTEMESKELLKAYNIPVVETIICETKEAACAGAEKLGFPVVLKLHSETITHKTDVGGVKLNLQNVEAVKRSFEEIEESVTRLKGREHFLGVTVQRMIKLEGYELILGSTIDIQFGPVLLFGSGGQLVEVFKDSTLGLPPLNATLARRMMEETKIYHALLGVRGRKAADLERLEQILVSFARMIAENPWIKECDINPLLASDKELIALDARVILHEAEIKELPHLSITPYPIAYVEPINLDNKLSVTLRPARPEDEPAVVAFHKDLSEKSVRARYFQFLSLEERVAHERLIGMLCADYSKELTLIAEKEDQIIAIARLVKIPGSDQALFKLIIADAFQGHGLGSKILDQIVEIAKREGISSLKAQILDDNQRLIGMCERRGFKTKRSQDRPHIVQVDLKLS